jgi:hypothetical protein
MGGLTLPIGVRRVGDSIAIVKPIAKRYSRSGTHGYYHFSGVDAIVFLETTNSGHRSVYVKCVSGDAALCDSIKRCASTVWVDLNGSPRDVIAALPLCR